MEVISPERAAAMVEAHEAMAGLATRLQQALPHLKIERVLDVDIAPAVCDIAVDALLQAPSSTEIQLVANIGRFIKEPADGQLVVSPRVPAAADTVILGVAVGTSVDGSLATVR